MGSNGLEKPVLPWSLELDIDTHLFSLGSDAIEELPGIRPVGRVDLQHILDDLSEWLRDIIPNFRILSFDNLFVEAVHILSPEWRLQGDHLVNNTT